MTFAQEKLNYKAGSVSTKNSLPFSGWQRVTNEIFYTQDGFPLDQIGTLGHSDPLLPRAKAIEFLAGGRTDAVHEIGPGNFSFAMHFTDYAQSKGKNISYTGHDFSESNYAFVKDTIAQYNENIKFSKTSFAEFPEKVKDSPIQVVMVELLDDTFTEFAARYKGLEGMVLVKPKMRSDAWFPSRMKYAKEQEALGKKSLETERMKKAGGEERIYTAPEIMDLIDHGNLDELKKVHPSFLNWMDYSHIDVGRLSIENDLYTLNYMHMPKEFESFGKSMLKYFGRQLEKIGDGSILHFPTAGLSFLWKMKDRNASIDIFDYGYEDAAEKVGFMDTHQGQITAPVNFEILKHAAEELGFTTLLEKNREFIKRNLNEDTIPLGYILKEMKEDYNDIDKIKKTCYEMFHKKVNELHPDLQCNEKDILSFRIRRQDYDLFRQAGIETGLLENNPVLKEGSYHLSLRK